MRPLSSELPHRGCHRHNGTDVFRQVRQGLCGIVDTIHITVIDISATDVCCHENSFLQDDRLLGSTLELSLPSQLPGHSVSSGLVGATHLSEEAGIAQPRAPAKSARPSIAGLGSRVVG